jgi:hypothetical protein
MLHTDLPVLNDKEGDLIPDGLPGVIDFMEKRSYMWITMNFNYILHP